MPVTSVRWVLNESDTPRIRRSATSGMIPGLAEACARDVTIQMYRRFCLIRCFETCVRRAQDEKRVKCQIYLALGQESVAAAVGTVMSGGYVLFQHRGHSFYLAFGGDPVRLIEILDKKKIHCNLVHLFWLKPFVMNPRIVEPLLRSGCGIVIDSAFEIGGAPQLFAYNLMLNTGLPVKALDPCDRSSGVAKNLENGTPTPERIADVVEDFIRSKPGGSK